MSNYYNLVLEPDRGERASLCLQREECEELFPRFTSGVTISNRFFVDLIERTRAIERIS